MFGTKSQQKRTLLRFDENLFKREIQDQEALIDNVIPKIKKEYEYFLGRSITNEELEGILKKGHSFVIEILRKEKNLLHANEEFVLEAHGKHITDANRKRSEYRFDLTPIVLDGFDFSGTKIKIKPETVKKLKNKHSYYIQSEAGQKVYDHMTKICESLNKLLVEGLVPEHKIEDVRSALDRFLEPRKLENGKYGLKINEKRIHQI
ncbi:hypothetical protein [Cytophaga sp. FL35]|uniref:hypothetical protein n=1 Tax=Cytophaga sp. FL35 TaxID=1904456 RepID=UPI001653B50C|nr:hypothetical protein [Cytophaga sp. FL35]MBC6999679.1 hypothetical protein [Cytophaga sp. FL35]